MQFSRQNLRTTILWVLALAAFLAYAFLAKALETNAEDLNNLALLKTSDIVGYSVVALFFAVLALVLKGNTHRFVNMIAGGVFAVIALLAFIDSFTVNMQGIYNLLLAVAVVLYGLIWWFALKTPKTT